MMTDTILNEATMEVIITLPWGEKETMPYKTYFARRFVAEHLSYKGRYKSIISEKEWETAYLMCDGYGEIISRELAQEQCWDWSHVRDSSNKTMLKVANWLAQKRWHLGSLDAIIEDLLTTIAKFKEEGRDNISPLEVVP